VLVALIRLVLVTLAYIAHVILRTQPSLGTFLLAYIEQATSFLAISTRNLLNNTFRAKGIKGLVISIVSLSSKGNIIVNTTPEFNSDFLVQNINIIKGVLPLVKSIQKGEL
jgi:hypothetical protein